jgi:RNase H-fold protein (predicted Holliday junction resolvase)
MSLERTGIPTVTVVTHSFAKYGRLLAKMQKMEQLPMIVIQHPVAAQPETKIRDDVSSHFGEVVEALLGG